jgi:hypothetical protein
MYAYTLGSEVFPAIRIFGVRREHLKDDHGIGLKVTRFTSSFARNHHIRIVEDLATSFLNLHLHVIDKCMAGLSAQCCVQGRKNVSGNQIVLLTGTRRGIDMASEIFVTAFTL